MLIYEGQIDYANEPHSFSTDQSETSFWYIAGLLLSRSIGEKASPEVKFNSKEIESCKDGHMYAVFIPLGEDSHCLLLGRKGTKCGNHLLRLHRGIRKPTALHDREECFRDESCTKETSGWGIHSGNVDEGGLYFILGTGKGLPPRKR